MKTSHIVLTSVLALVLIGGVVMILINKKKQDAANAIAAANAAAAAAAAGTGLTTTNTVPGATTGLNIVKPNTGTMGGGGLGAAVFEPRPILKNKGTGRPMTEAEQAAERAKHNPVQTYGERVITLDPNWKGAPRR